ncbi:MAG: Tat pathway signal protein [Caulobacteraceae bacterium]
MRRRLFLTALAVALTPGLALAAAERKKGGGLSYIQFTTFTVTVRRPAGGRGVLSVDAGVDVADPGLHTRADQSKPILRDAYMRWLTMYGLALPPGAPPNLDQIQAELQRATDRTLGRPGAKLLIGSVMVN